MLIIYFGIFATVFFMVALAVLFWRTPHERVAMQRLESAVKEIGGANTPTPEKPQKTDVVKNLAAGLLLKISVWLKHSLGARDNPQVRDRFARAGLKSRHATDYYFGARILAPGLGLLMGSFSPWNPIICATVLGCMGYLGPNFWLERKIKARRKRISKSMPEIMDLVYVCVDAGLGMDQALIRVAQSMGETHADIYDEFMRISREQRAGKPRVDAWKAMGERTGLPEVEGFVSMLVQTERFGTPISKALAMFSDDLRTKRRQIAEEKAAKTSVKMIFPLVLFIFPSIFIVLLGPAIMSISHSLAGLGK